MQNELMKYKINILNSRVLDIWLTSHSVLAQPCFKSIISQIKQLVSSCGIRKASVSK